MRYTTVLFDVGETLIGPRLGFGEIYARALSEHGLELPAERLERAIRAIARQIDAEHPEGEDRYRLAEGGETGYWRRFAERVVREAGGGTTPLAEHAFNAVRERFRRPEAWLVYDDTRPALETLQARGVRLGVVSNWDSRLGEVLRLLDLERYFEQLGVSAVEGTEKPAPLLFERVLERMGVAASEALHVGDRPEMDLDGARRAGIDAVLIDRHGRHPDRRERTQRLEPLADWTRDGLPWG